MIKVKNLTSPRSGLPAANQFVIYSTIHKNRIFQSYETVIAKYNFGGKLILDRNCLNYSRTTSKYLYQFTGKNRTEIKFMIDNGLVEIRDLNI